MAAARAAANVTGVTSTAIRPIAGIRATDTATTQAAAVAKVADKVPPVADAEPAAIAPTPTCSTMRSKARFRMVKNRLSPKEIAK